MSALFSFLEEKKSKQMKNKEDKIKKIKMLTKTN
jgi:hypothetical protein